MYIQVYPVRNGCTIAKHLCLLIDMIATRKNNLNLVSGSVSMLFTANKSFFCAMQLELGQTVKKCKSLIRGVESEWQECLLLQSFHLLLVPY